MNPIDVHILRIPSTRQDWLDVCLASLVDEPVNVRVIPGVEGNIGAGRAAGFALGEAQYVALVDPDDWVLPGGFAACLRVFNDYPEADAVGTYELYANENGEIVDRTHYQPHHLMVYRRSAITPLLADLATKIYLPEQWLLTQVSAIYMVPAPYYVWRQHPDAWHTKNRQASADAHAEYIQYRAPLKLTR